MALSADRIPTLFDEVVRHTQALTACLGSSVGDDIVNNRPLLGPSIGDDGAPQSSLGASIGDDLVLNRPLLGPSIGDDGIQQPNSLGGSIGDDLVLILRTAALGPSIGDDGVPSDRRLKTDIEAVGATVLGLPLYRFRYIGHDPLFEGVMAQDVLAVLPEAVSVASDGFYRVNYARLGTTFRRIG